MISLEQIRTLESKVNKAVSLLAALQEENHELKAQLATARSQIEELEFTVEEYREDQTEIEQGIMSALQHLDHLENAVGVLKPQAEETVSAPAQTTKTIPAPAAETIEPVHAPVQVIDLTPAAGTSEETRWEAPAQQFQQPAAVSEDDYESEEILDSDEEEAAKPAPSRDQQLDIF